MIRNLKNSDNTESIEQNTTENTSDQNIEKNNLIENTSLHTMSPVIVNNDQNNIFNESVSNGYIVEVPLNLPKQPLQTKVKKNNPDDILQTIKQYHNVRLDDAKRTLK